MKILSEREVVLLVCVLHHVHSRFSTDYNCRESRQSSEFVNDVINYVTETADYFNRIRKPDLDLSTLGLGFVDDKNFLVQNYPNFLSLNLSMNVIKNIDVSFVVRFPEIQVLDFSKNCLTTLDVFHRSIFFNLQHLNISNNLITHVHPFTFSNLSLEYVDVSHNRLLRFWAADYELKQLHLNDNKITQIEIDSKHFKEMKLLDARNNQIRILQVNVDFEDLLLSNNQLILDEYFLIRNVYGTLDLSRNKIDEFDWKIIGCVTNLNLSYNRLMSLECSSKRFQRVERLNLDGNLLCNFSQLVNITTCLPNLKFISIMNNRLSGVAKIKVKTCLTSLGVKSQVFDYDSFPQLDDDCKHFNIFKVD